MADPAAATPDFHIVAGLRRSFPRSPNRANGAALPRGPAGDTMAPTAGKATLMATVTAGAPRRGQQAMEKGLCWGALGVAGVLLLVFLADLFVGLFIGDALVDIAGILMSGIVVYLALNALKDIR